MTHYFCVFTDENEAIAAEQFLRDCYGMPIDVYRASDGQPMPNNQKVEMWAEVKQRLDGKWIFPYPHKTPRYILTTEQQLQFDQFDFTLEEMEGDWFE